MWNYKDFHAGRNALLALSLAAGLAFGILLLPRFVKPHPERHILPITIDGKRAVDPVRPEGKVREAGTSALRRKEDVQPSPSESSITYTIQVGCFSSEENAAVMAAAMRRKGYETVIENNESGAFLVLAGRFADKDAADQAADRLRSENCPAFVRSR